MQDHLSETLKSTTSQQAGRSILDAYLYALQILPCSFPPARASCLKRELKGSEASCASSSEGSPDRAPCPDARHKRSSVKSQLASNQQGSPSALVDSANPLHKATGQAVCRVIKQKQKPGFS